MHRTAPDAIRAASPRARLLLALAAALALLASAATAVADTVTLRASVRVAADRAVSLADIAELEGARATALSTAVVADASSSAREVTADAVRARLAAAGADLSEIRFRGERSIVRPLAAGATAPREAAREKAPATEPRPARHAAPVVVDPSRHEGLATPLGLVSDMLVHAFGVDGAQLELHIAEEDLARLAPRGSMRVEIAARSALRADSVAFEVIFHDGDEIASRERVRVLPRVVREVAVASEPIRRGRPVAPESVSIERRALAPTVAARAADPTLAMGATLTRSINRGAVLAQEDLVAAASIRRNDRVLVRREVGGVVIELEAVALEDGAVGDTIAFTRPGVGRARDAKQIHAEVVGNGRAIVR
ncbi:MAG: flagellar basal body P-ring formation protein FlgA [Phycisphaera sp.]|nr:flagellar basal body P-ring formation protein FlgA [Phycisphaera sp.]